MRHPTCALFVSALIMAAVASPASAQRIHIDSVATADTSLRHEMRLRDGSRLVGRIIAVSTDSVRIWLQSQTLTVARSAVAEVREFPSSNIRNGEYWPENSNPTRLLFSATAYSLARGEGYYWNAWLFLNGFAVGVADRLTLGGGFSLIPGIDFGENFFFVTPKVTLTGREGPQFAVGALAGVIPGLGSSSDDESDTDPIGIVYGVSSFGSRESNFSAGLGWGFAGRDIANKPVVMLGAQIRFARRVAFISENWLEPSGDDSDGIVSYGLRFLGEKLSVDLAFINFTGEMIFPGVPWLGFAVKF